MTRWPDIPPLTDEEEAEIQRRIASDPDTWEASEQSLRAARPFAEAFPHLIKKERAKLPVK